MTKTEPHYASFSVATGTGTTSLNAPVAVPSNCHIRYVTAYLAATSQGPVWCQPLFNDAQGPWEILGHGGWIRSDPNYLASDPYTWAGDIGVGGFSPPVSVDIRLRNDTGSTIAGTLIVITEVP